MDNTNIKIHLLKRNKIYKTIQNKELNKLYINYDDTIDVVKRKIIYHLKDNVDERSINELSVDEIYLMGSIKRYLTIDLIYNEITQNGELKLTKDLLLNYLVNILGLKFIRDLPNKEIYNKDDLKYLDLSEPINFLIPIGQKYSLNRDFYYSSNPYELISISPIIQKNIHKIISTNNKNLLFDYGSFIDDEIYVCMARDILEYHSSTFTDNILLNLYYPFLIQQKLNSIDDIIDKEDELYSNTKKLIGKDFKDRQQIIEYYNELNKNNIFKKEGIHKLYFGIHQPTKNKINIQNIFKILHSNETLPFIKMNEGLRREKMLRLYAPEVAMNGKKIPYLQSKDIFRINKLIGKNKTISFYVYDESMKLDKTIIYFEIDELLNLNVYYESESKKLMDNVWKLVWQYLSPIIENLNEYYKTINIQLLNKDELDITSEFIEIYNLEYYLEIDFNKSLEFGNFDTCFYPIVNIIRDDEPFLLQYKRVSNFNEMDSIETFMVLQTRNGLTDEELVSELMKNFGLEKENAIQRIAEWLSKVQVQRDVYNSNKLRIKNNPGFPIEIKRIGYSNSISINVLNINDIQYIPFLKKYIQGFIKLLENENISETIKNKCKGKENIKEIEIKDIQNQNETPLLNNQKVVSIEDDELIFGENDDFMDEFFGNEDVDLEDDFLDEMIEEEMAQEETIQEETEKEKEREKEKKEKKLENKGVDVKKRKKITQDIKTMKLRNYFSDKMFSLDPKLFLKKEKNKYRAYSRICPSNVRRQPVILTDEEKAHIDKTNPGSYQNAIRYGSSEDNKNWYICPRYWCLKDNIPLTEEDVKAGKCGGKIIPSDAKKVPDDAFIYEFNSHGKEHIDEKGEYIKHHPGFLGLDAHPDGLCIPCCFKNWDSIQQIQRRQKCIKNNDDIIGETIDITSENIEDRKREVNKDYIKGFDKFPLEKERFGILKPTMENMLQINSTECMISPSQALLKENKPCLLRYGVENNEKQSFLCVINDLLNTELNKNMNLQQFKKYIIKNLLFDDFININDGDLIEIFYNKDKKGSQIKCMSSKFSKKLNIQRIISKEQKTEDDKRKLELFNKSCSAYNNFINYLKDDEIIIDYEYVWDLFSRPNPLFFSKGINIILFRILDDDITDNIDIVCPPNYISSRYSKNKPSVFIIKDGVYFEPIYKVENIPEKSKMDIKKFFEENTKFKPIKKFIEFHKLVNDKCMAKPSLPNVYKFKYNINADELLRRLDYYKIKTIKQVKNLKEKVIGLVVLVNNKELFIPSKPSSKIENKNIDEIYLFDIPRLPYTDTRDLLEYIFKKSNNRIPCSPALKVMEDGLIVGILTITNQFIEINEPTEDIYDDNIKNVYGINYMMMEEKILDNNTDKERSEMIKRVKLESMFYNFFRLKIHDLLNRLQYLNIKNEIKELISNSYYSYEYKLEIMKNILDDLIDNHFEFVKFKWEVLDGIQHINSNKENNIFCKNKNGSCVWLLPNKHLISRISNEIIYKNRIADELIRYSNYQRFLLKTDDRLMEGEVTYKINDNEMVILESILDSNYFKSLEIIHKNKYIRQPITYQTVNPLKSIPISNKIEFDLKRKIEVPCVIETTTITGTIRKYFDNQSYRLQEIDESKNCGFEFLKFLIYASNEKEITKNEIEQLLINTYKKLLQKNSKLYYILLDEGKRKFIEDFEKNMDIELLIKSDDFYISNIDLFIVAYKYNLYFLLFSGVQLNENDNKFLGKINVALPINKQKLLLIKQKARKINKAYEYGIVDIENKYLIDFIDLKGNTQKEVKENIVADNLDDFIEERQLVKLAKRKKIVIRQ